MVAPGGLLLVSTHDLSVRPAGYPDPPNGFLFESSSEIPELEEDDYGTCWVNERFMNAVVAEDTSGKAIRFPRALWSYQDVYAIARELPVGAPTVGEPLAYLFYCRHDPSRGVLQLAGWAADPQARGPVQIIARLNEVEVASCLPDASLAEVELLLRRKDLGPTGWQLEIELENGRFDPRLILSLSAVSTDGRERLLHLDTLKGSVLFETLENQFKQHHRTAARVQELEQTVSSMEASRF